MVDPIGFTVGPVSQAAAKLLALAVATYALLTARYTLNAIQQRLPDRGSAVMATWVMVGLAILLWVHGERLLPAPFSLVVLAAFVIGIAITLGYTLGNMARRLEEWREDLRGLIEEWAEKALPESQREAWLQNRFAQLHPEQKRKTPHLMMGLFVVGYVGLGYAILRGIEALVPADAVVGENLSNLHAALSQGVMPAGHMVAITALLAVLLLLLPVEMLRLQFPQAAYPFKGTITSMLRERERGLFGAHYYIAATLPMAVLWLTDNDQSWDVTLFAVIAMLGVSVFADSASAIVGIRWGKHKWPHHRGKSIEGTVGGCVVALLVALPFVGVPVAIVSAVVFFIVDVLAPVPISVSDNILNPLALAAAYILLQDQLAPLIPFY